jgi:hypothetical protein
LLKATKVSKGQGLRFSNFLQKTQQNPPHIQGFSLLKSFEVLHNDCKCTTKDTKSKGKGGNIKMKQYFFTSYNLKEIVLIWSPIDNRHNFWLPLDNHMHIQQLLHLDNW